MKLVTCSCCGDTIEDTEEENVSYGLMPYPDDEGYGTCTRCGGDRKAQGDSDDQIKKRIGWAAQAFYEARFEILSKKLSPVNSAKFLKMNYGDKMNVVDKMINSGSLV